MKLPEKFLSRIKTDIKKEYEDFIKIYQSKPYHGIRLNTTKISREEFLSISPFELETVPWDENGFAYDAERCKPSKHPLYHAGLYYIQEPSAMAPANLLKPKRGDVVMDLCAAPGGKSVQLSSMIGDSGLMVCNDINPKRVRALLRNMEWFGIRNVIVLNENPVKLADKWRTSFDCILVDAPCSGEGMFRRDSKAADSWEQYEGKVCTDVQSQLIRAAGSMLKDEGRMVYSTCTFGRSENEGIVSGFVDGENGFELGMVPNSFNISGELTSGTIGQNHGFGRIWPHLHKGEGHFMAVVNRCDGSEPKDLRKWGDRMTARGSDMDAVTTFLAENLNGYENYMDRIEFHDSKAYVRPELNLDLRGVKYVRNGWYIGDVKNGKFLPSQSFAMGLKKNEAFNTIDLDMGSPDALKYLKGETINTKCSKKWYLVCVEGYPLGWGKGQGGSLKNMYNKHWRMQG